MNLEVAKPVLDNAKINPFLLLNFRDFPNNGRDFPKNNWGFP
jgi:hypothetical protein